MTNTGPVHIYVGVNAAPPTNPFEFGTPVYLGTCEMAPRIRLNPQYTPVMNDIGGVSLPFEYLFSGEDGLVFGDLTRWNWPVLKRIHSRPSFNKAVPGIGEAMEVGTLMATEGYTYALWLHFPYFAKPVFANAGMPAGYRFYSSFLIGPDELTPGTGVNKIHVQWQNMRAYNPATAKFSLYDYDMTGVPAIPPTSPTGV